MTYNLIKTIKAGVFLEIEEDQAPALDEYQAHSKNIGTVGLSVNQFN
jgi:hypothetical protein